MELIEPSPWLLITQITMFVYFGLWIYAVIDLLKSDFRKPNQKLIWTLLLIFVPIFGTFLYLSMSRRDKVRDTRFEPYFEKKFNFRKK
ncbi:PLD nuclease N-terminal domain-containing protein [Algoriphagus namhaensis]